MLCQNPTKSGKFSTCTGPIPTSSAINTFLSITNTNYLKPNCTVRRGGRGENPTIPAEVIKNKIDNNVDLPPKLACAAI